MKKRTKRRLRRWGIGVVATMLLLSVMAMWVLRGVYPMPPEYRDTVTAAAEKHGVAPSLIWAVIHTESGFSPDARSSAGAVGLMQVTAPTMEWVMMRDGIEEVPAASALTDGHFNIEIGTSVLRLLGERFAVQDTVLAAYNAGMGNVQTWLADPSYSADGETLTVIPFKETAQYVKRVRRAQTIYKLLYGVRE